MTTSCSVGNWTGASSAQQPPTITTALVH
jgi:hypothetical protein